MAFPTVNTCFVCELARPEQQGKVTLLGYFGVAPHVRIKIQNFNQPIQLCFVFAGGPGQGHFQIGLRITAPNGATFNAPNAEGNLSQEASHSNFFMNFLGVLPSPGNYTATLTANGAPQYQAQFALDPMQAPGGLGQPN